MKKLLFILLVFVYSRQINAQTYVLIPDANFRAYLNTIVPSAMSGNSLNITSTLVTTATQTISVSTQNISNLTGVQYFTSLQYLDCSNNSLNSLPSLPNSLQYLNCEQNFILTSLPILPNSIQYLKCIFNSLNSLPLLPNSLTYINCSFNTSLSVLPSLPNSLQTLDCGYNSLTYLPTLPNFLNYLSCGNNSIVCFPTFHDSIKSIYLSPNPYNCLPNYVLPAMNNYTNVPLCTTGNMNGCTVGIKQFSNDNIILKTYPNPNKGVFKLQLDVDITNGMAVLINALGQNVYECKVVKGINEITATELTKGFYTLILLQNKQPIGRTKVVIE